MKVSEFTKRALKIRRDRRDRVAEGWEYVGEGGGKLWELHRGYRIGHTISEVEVDAIGNGLWIKVNNPTPQPIPAPKDTQ